MLSLDVPARTPPLHPLAWVTFHVAVAGAMEVTDGAGRCYHAAAVDPGAHRCQLGGALGSHRATLTTEDGAAASVTFRVDAHTRFDAPGPCAELYRMAWMTMHTWGEGSTIIALGGKPYRYFVRWLRDHVHVLKGMKYFCANLKSGIELYADYQREDGMIWDRIEKCGPEVTWRDHTFSYGDFIRTVDDVWRFERIPVEADVEYLFIEGLYFTWKACGDDAWMIGLLDHALRAVHYALHDPYRWSAVHQLIKRGFTIDTWDFQADQDAARTTGPMEVFLDRTRFGIMHGDNTGMAQSLLYLAEMLTVARRGEEAAHWRDQSNRLRERLDAIAWNGTFYTHHVPEDATVQRDLGVDLNRQVSLSNAYALNRGIRPEQAHGIIATYQRLRDEMPTSSPGEFYQIYPPFERGFGDHNGKWHYMNAGVSTIVAGELARGAFFHGAEAYGVDILQRVAAWGDRYDGYLPCCLRGAGLDVPDTHFTPVDLRAVANADLAGEGAEGVPGWLGEGPDNDLRYLPAGSQTFCGVPTEVIDPATNGRRACLGLSTSPGYARTVDVSVQARARTLYLHHTTAGGRDRVAGTLTVHYADGESCTRYLLHGREVGSWYLPTDIDRGKADRLGLGEPCRVAWRGRNARFPNVGTYLTGLVHPRPDAEIARLTFQASVEGGHWMVLGLTLSDQPPFLGDDGRSFGIPDNWGAAALMYALIEGLAGVVDNGVAFDRARLCPRWSAAATDHADIVVRYPASDGYLAYTYRFADPALTLVFTGAAAATDVALLLPSGRSLAGLTLDGVPTTTTVEAYGESHYACFTAVGPGPFTVVATLAPPA